MSKKISVFTDGGSRGNPGPAAFGYVIREGNILLKAHGQTIGSTTNNVAEYSGILAALQWIADNRESIGEISGINMYMDSLLACQQLKGIFKMRKPHLAVFLIKIREIERKIKIPVYYEHIPREKNKEADSLVNQALDNTF